MTTLKISDINDTDRVRKDLKDIDGMVKSITRFGLLQPIRINANNELILGGRRLTAMKKLGWTELVEGKHFVYESDSTPVFLKEAELEENLQRSDFTWQERIKGIVGIHNIRLLHSLQTPEADRWLQEHTGELLGLSQATVSIALKVAPLLDSDPEVASQSNLRDVLVLLTKRKENEASAELAKRTGNQVIGMPAGIPTQQPAATTPSVAATIDALNADLSAIPDEPPVVSPTLANRFILGNCIEVMRTFADESVPHILTDPPYGIDMANLNQTNLANANIESVVATHVVSENQELFAVMLPEFFRILKPTGFCVMFCDASQWQLLYDLSTKAGFAVQNWPLVWMKTSPCRNGAPGHNFTKNYELAMVLRKKDARLLSPQLSSVGVFSAMEDRAKFDHPFVKPQKLWLWLIDAIVPRTDWFLDPFAGEGSSILAGLSAGITPVGIEIDPTHHSKMINHVSAFLAKPTSGEPELAL